VKKIQGSFRAHSGSIQGKFREHSGPIQGTFRAHSRNIQGPFREHLGPVQATFEHRGNIWCTAGARDCRVAVRGQDGAECAMQGTFKHSGNIEGPFREHLNIEGTFGARQNIWNINRSMLRFPHDCNGISSLCFGIKLISEAKSCEWILKCFGNFDSKTTISNKPYKKERRYFFLVLNHKYNSGRRTRRRDRCWRRRRS
jgi:hypothetical protein